MKISNEHYAILENAFNAVAAYGESKGYNFADDTKKKLEGGMSIRAICSDSFRAVDKGFYFLKGEYISDYLYNAGLNDDNIYAAMKKILGLNGRLIKI